MDSRTVGKRLADAELDQKQTFTTKEVFAAMLGDFTAERIGETRARRIKLELENAERLGELAPVKELIPKLGKCFESARAFVLSDARLEDDTKDAIIKALAGLVAETFGGPAIVPNDAAEIHGEPVGRAVPVSEPGV